MLLNCPKKHGNENTVCGVQYGASALHLPSAFSIYLLIEVHTACWFARDVHRRASGRKENFGNLTQFCVLQLIKNEEIIQVSFPVGTTYIQDGWISCVCEEKGIAALLELSAYPRERKKFHGLKRWQQSVVAPEFKLNLKTASLLLRYGHCTQISMLLGTPSVGPDQLAVQEPGTCGGPGPLYDLPLSTAQQGAAGMDARCGCYRHVYEITSKYLWHGWRKRRQLGVRTGLQLRTEQKTSQLYVE
jgi:hypothetical protein